MLASLSNFMLMIPKRSYGLVSVLVIVFLVSDIPTCFGQDTLHYENFPFSWCPSDFILYKASKKAKKGTYHFRTACDDGHYSFRNGNFYESKQKIVFGSAYTVSFQRFLDSRNEDSLTVGVPIDTMLTKDQIYLKRGDTLVDTEKPRNGYLYFNYVLKRQ